MRFILSVCIIFYAVLSAQPAQACESCAITHIGKKDKLDVNQQQRVRAKVMYEHQDWKESDARALHELHHDGKHMHNKQNEEIIHTMLSVDVIERLSIDVDIPYVTKHYIEIDSHPHMGENQVSRGLGDIVLTGDYRFIHDEKKSFGIIAGFKLPTGETGERNSFGGLMEPELQPGTGSLDYIGGLSGALHPGSMDVSASAIYIHRTEGKQHFRAGDLLSVTFNAGNTFELPKNFNLRTGVMLNNQLEKKQNTEDGPIKDSGGYTMLVGPQLSVSHDNVSVEFAYLFPAVQHLGGVHQELDHGMWTTSLGVKF